MSLTNYATQRTMKEEDIVRLLHQKDEQVMAVLYEKYSIALFGVIHRMLTDQKLAEEQLQECFLKIWNYADKYDPQKGRLFTWMLQIARNTAIDATRTKRFKQEQKIQNLEKSVSIIERSNPVKFNTDQIGIRELVEKLNTKYALIIDTIYFRGYTQAEAAEELDLPLGTVKTRVRKALRLLKDHLI